VKLEAEATRVTDENADDDAGAACGAGGDAQGRAWHRWGRQSCAWCGLARQGRAWRDDSLRSTCNRRGVGWSNRSNQKIGLEGVQVVERFVSEEATSKDDSSKMTCRETNKWFMVRSRHRYPLCSEE
jgi:hypothetical protein